MTSTIKITYIDGRVENMVGVSASPTIDGDGFVWFEQGNDQSTVVRAGQIRKFEIRIEDSDD